ncbi:MAG: DUF669 domain-containing protein [Planctomycetota bacterium]|nr:DUF669 domain-containing protein [Planctomycetota bacterium]MDG1985970.1 DUF669 domain-containing protein [Planctomycetota bacterium]
MRIEACDGTDVDDFVVVEDGEYQMRVGEARSVETTGGSAAWMLRMELTDGDLAGRTAVLDWLNFTDRGLRRVRMVLAALGFDVTTSMDVEPEELIGREAMVTIATQESRRESDGRLFRRSRVAYDGWGVVDPEHEGAGRTV